jgi:vacuolar-type H+-ATPase subunit E/Vma4
MLEVAVAMDIHPGNARDKVVSVEEQPRQLLQSALGQMAQSILGAAPQVVDMEIQLAEELLLEVLEDPELLYFDGHLFLILPIQAQALM